MSNDRGQPRAETSPVILVAGAINTDLVGRSTLAPTAGETVTGHGFAIFGGGKGANQAFAVARSEVRTAMLGAVGDDDFGRARRDDLEAEGIVIDHVATRAGMASGVALIMVDDAGENRILYVPGPTLTLTVTEVERAIAAVRPQVLLLTLEPPLAVLDRLVTLATAQAVPVILNATPEPEAGKEIAIRADVLIVNETEACQLLGIAPGTVTWPEVIMRLRAMGPATVVATLGADGAIVGTGDKIDAIPAEELELRVQALVRRLRWKGPTFAVSAVTHEGLDRLLRAAYEHVAAAAVPAAMVVDPRFADGTAPQAQDATRPTP